MAKKKTKLYAVEVRWVECGKVEVWAVNHGTDSTPFTNKLNAIRHARQVAKANQPSSLIVFTKDQRHQEERTYPRSRDPRRSKG